jgi:hypothetical protein
VPRALSRRLASGIGRLAGFGVSMVLLAVASLATINAMVTADGPTAWGAIVLGQTVGTISCIIVGYGWALSGPAKIAHAGGQARRREYADSIRVRIALLVPLCLVSAVVAGLLDRDQVAFAAAGAISFTLTGLTASWYFVGVARPFAMLVLETFPRVAGSVAGIVLMKRGFGAIVGLASISAGMVAGFLIVTIWVYKSTAGDTGAPVPKRPLGEVFVSQWNGVISASMSGVYYATPMAIVALVAPASQPAFALADKVNRQFTAALVPFFTVLQGWVPRGLGDGRRRRARAAMAATCVAAALLAVGIIVVAQPLFHLLGDGQITIPLSVTVLVALIIAVGLIDQVLAKAVLASFDKLGVVTRATVWSAVVGFPLVLIGAYQFGAAGAFGGFLIGLLVRVGLEVAGYLIGIEAPSRRLEKQTAAS